MCVQTFLTELAIEAFDKSIITWFVRSREVQHNSFQIDPWVKVRRDKLAAIVDLNKFRISKFLAYSFEYAYDILILVTEPWIGCW